MRALPTFFWGPKAMFQRLKDEGRINPTLDIEMLTKVFVVIGDGLFWRRAVMPDYDVREVLPVLTSMIGTLVRPVESEGGTLEETHS